MTAHSFVRNANVVLGTKRFAHVVQHAEEQHDVERSERTQVALHEVGDDGFDATAGERAAFAEQRIRSQ